MKNYVITIARGFGSGGKYIGTKLGERLGIPCYEREILAMASEESGLHESIFARTDEKLRGSYLIHAIRSLRVKKNIQPEDREFTSDKNLFQIQCGIIRTLAETESCVIIGKCADYVLADRENVLSVYVDAPRKACVESIMAKMNVTEREANRLIERTDRYRADYYKYYTGGKDWVNPTNYHLFLNSDKIGRDRCVDLLEGIVTQMFRLPASPEDQK